jgi:rhodanese-related sulfurtransferase
MKKIIVHTVIVFAFVLVTITAATAQSAGGYTKVSGQELQEMLADGGAITVVDVREPRLFNKGRVPGAINIPYNGARERVLKELNKEDRIVFVCHGGPMGDELADILIDNGYKYVYNLERGMWGWHGELEK